MTTPCERTRALIQTRELLESLQDPSETPRVPRWLRAEATRLLRHYLSDASLQVAHHALPDWFASVPHFGEVRGPAETQGTDS